MYFGSALHPRGASPLRLRSEDGEQGIRSVGPDVGRGFYGLIGEQPGEHDPQWVQIGGEGDGLARDLLRSGPFRGPSRRTVALLQVEASGQRWSLASEQDVAGLEVAVKAAFSV